MECVCIGAGGCSAAAGSVGRVRIFSPRERIGETRPHNICEGHVGAARQDNSISAVESRRIVAVDIRQMDRLFANLLYNAIRYTPEGGEIALTLRTLPESGRVEIGGADSGPGIEPADAACVLDRYYRKSHSRSSGMGGGGLGLANSKEIVDLRGGLIDVRHSKDEGGGCVFRIELPSRN